MMNPGLKRVYTRFAINFRYAFNIRKPRLMARLAKNYFNLLFFKNIPLRYVDVAVDYRCNLRCLHCSAARFSRQSSEKMFLDDYRRLGRQCLEMGAVTVGLTGGEPTLCPDLGEIIKAFHPERTMITLITNAVLFDEEKILGFKKLGVDVLCVSLDSYSADEHDAFRGVKGAHQKALQAIDLALKHSLKVAVATTITHQNLRSDSIRSLIEMTKEKGLLMIFSLACPAGRWSREDEKILLDQEDIKYMNSLFGVYPHLRRDFESNWLTAGCGAGNEKLYFTPDGEVLPCPFIHITFGNVKKEPLPAIHARLMKIPEFKGYPPKCLSGEDRDFSGKYVVKANTREKVPVDYTEIFTD